MKKMISGVGFLFTMFFATMMISSNSLGVILLDPNNPDQQFFTGGVYTLPEASGDQLFGTGSYTVNTTALTHQSIAYGQIDVNASGTLVWNEKAADPNSPTRYRYSIILRQDDENYVVVQSTIPVVWPRINDRGLFVWYSKSALGDYDVFWSNANDPNLIVHQIVAVGDQFFPELSDCVLTCESNITNRTLLYMLLPLEGQTWQILADTPNSDTLCSVSGVIAVWEESDADNDRIRYKNVCTGENEYISDSHAFAPQVYSDNFGTWIAWCQGEWENPRIQIANFENLLNPITVPAAGSSYMQDMDRNLVVYMEYANSTTYSLKSYDFKEGLSVSLGTCANIGNMPVNPYGLIAYWKNNNTLWLSELIPSRVSTPARDLDNNGDVDLSDLDIFCANWIVDPNGYDLEDFSGFSNAWLLCGHDPNWIHFPVQSYTCPCQYQAPAPPAGDPIEDPDPIADPNLVYSILTADPNDPNEITIEAGQTVTLYFIIEAEAGLEKTVASVEILPDPNNLGYFDLNSVQFLQSFFFASYSLDEETGILYITVASTGNTISGEIASFDYISIAEGDATLSIQDIGGESIIATTEDLLVHQITPEQMMMSGGEDMMSSSMSVSSSEETIDFSQLISDIEELQKNCSSDEECNAWEELLIILQQDVVAENQESAMDNLNAE